MNDRVDEYIRAWIGKADNDLKMQNWFSLPGTRTVLMTQYAFTVSTAGFLLTRRYGNRVMMNCCHLWWTCGPYKAYAAELMADFCAIIGKSMRL